MIEPFNKARYNEAKLAEDKLISLLNEEGYCAMSIHEFLGKKWTALLDAMFGDIEVFDVKTGKQYFIDVKRTLDSTVPSNWYGTITRTRQSEPFRKKDNTWYALSNYEMTSWKFVKASKLNSDPLPIGNYWKTKDLSKYWSALFYE